MRTSARVKIWGMKVGIIVWDSTNGYASFQYDKNFSRTGLQLSPFKLQSNPYEENKTFTFGNVKFKNETFKELPGLLADSLPDKYGNALISAWLTKRGLPSESFNPVQMLCFIGNRGMGALEFEPDSSPYNNKSSEIEISSLIKMASDILSERKKFRSKLSAHDQKSMMDIIRIGTSAGGARAKAIIAYNPKTHEVRSGQTDAPIGFSHWIIKFDGISADKIMPSQGYGRVEMAYYRMAQDVGIEMTECRLFKENGRSHFMTKRFDRVGNNKIHTQSFCALRHFNFNDVLSYSYEQLFETMRFLKLPYPQFEQMYRRMVFNVVGMNCDDHTKNFSFLMDTDGRWKLSPAFDISFAYREGSKWVNQHALSVNGKRYNIDRCDLLEVAKIINLKNAVEIIDEISKVIGNWNEYANKEKVRPSLRNAIDEHLMIL